MIDQADLDTSHPFLAQARNATGGPVTLINTFVAPEGKVDEVLAAWTKDAEYFKTKPGFVSTQLMRGVAGSRILTNIAVWESVQQLVAAFGTPEHAESRKRYPDGTVAYPHLFEKVAIEGICGGE